MKKPLLLFLLFSICLISQTSLAQPGNPNIAATGYLLLDMQSGQLLVEKNAKDRLEPASLTKIMTAYVVFNELHQGSLKLSDLVHVSKKAWKTPGSHMFIEVNTKVSIEDLLRGLIIQSGNDAAVALAEHIAGSESAFADIMNQHAQKLGMLDTNFTNATGLPDEEHYTTPLDVAKVTQAVIRQFPDFYKLYSEKEFTYNEIRQYNRNNLLWRDNSVDGVKTGHTEAAGYCLVASAKRDDMRLVSVVMGTESRKARIKASKTLLNHGFRFYESHQLYKAGQALKQERIWFAEKNTLELGLAENLNITIPRGQYGKLKALSEVAQTLEAPIRKGQIVGKVVIELSGKQVAQAPLVALHDAPAGNLWRKLVDSALQMVQ
jgi:D-alanyl-D-alanine carboxypeptidase (penicillin-binding protein 5/6)